MHTRNPLTWLTNGATDKAGRWVVLALWIVIAGALIASAPNVANYYNDKATSSIGNQESVRAAALIQQAFPNQNGIPTIIVLNDPHGLTAADRQHVTTISCWLLSDAARTADNCPTVQAPARPPQVGAVLSTFTVPQAASQLVSADGTTTTIIATLNTPESDTTTLQSTISAIRAYATTFTGNGSALVINVTGPAAILSDLVNVFQDANLPLLLTTVALVLILLFVIYRSPILAFLPLVGVGVALQIVNSLLGFAAKGGLFPVGQQPISIMEVLLFGAGTDYVIFIVARYREELQHEASHIVALQTTMVSVGEAITSSAGTVILTLLTLTLAVLGLYSALGWVLAIAVAVMLLAGLTLIPAVLSLLGRAAFWPFIPKPQAIAATTEAVPQRGFWPGMARFVAKRPTVAVVGSVVFLVILALGNLGVPDVYNSLTDLRKPTDATQGYQVLAHHFAPGTLAPFNVVLHLASGNAYEQLAALDQVDQAIAKVKNVAEVQGPTRPDGNAPQIAPAALALAFAQLPPQLTQAIRAGNTSAFTSGSGNAQIIGLYAASVPYVSDDSLTVSLQVTLAIDPYSVPALDAIAPIRAAASQAVQKAGLGIFGTEVLLGGVTPQLADTRAVSDHDKLVVVPLVLALVAIVLGLLLRSVVAPLYLLFAITLNYFAALGASAFLFTKLQGQAGISYATPLYTFIFLVALGADYTIFLMSRVREEAARRGLVEGTQVAVSRTGGVITSAGLILAGTFLVLTTLPLNTLYTFGVAVALGVLLDTFVVRGLLVPGTVLLLGQANWWPGKLKSTAS
jgi:uncharacterized membrane protein YdfJ with MMPL/SSD domain